MKRALFLLSCLLVLAPTLVHAQADPFQNLDNTAEGLAQGGQSPPPLLSNYLGDIIQAALSILGVVFFVLALYAGFLWMTAAGNKEQVDKAKRILIQTTIGILIVLGAYAITATFLDELTGIVTG